jgi:4-hydroxy-tetrahydrodipicolinate synthase
MNHPASVPHQGVWPAMLTPLQADGNLDHARLVFHAKRLLAAGCSGVTLFGTTGEGPSFSVAERMAALEALLQGGVLPTQLLVHTSCAALPDTVALTRHAAQHAVHGCLVLPPFFFKGVSDDGILDCYHAVIGACAGLPLRVVLYHIPQVTGLGLSHRVIAELLQRYPDVIIGLKDSGCQRVDSVAYATAFMPPMQVWVGNEADVPEMATLGTRGAVSGVANILPGLVDRLVTGRDPVTVQADLDRVKAFLTLIGGYTMVPAFKGLMAIIDQDPAWLNVRAPLRALSPAEFERLRQQWSSFQPGGGLG